MAGSSTNGTATDTWAGRTSAVPRAAAMSSRLTFSCAWAHLCPTGLLESPRHSGVCKPPVQLELPLQSARERESLTLSLTVESRSR